MSVPAFQSALASTLKSITVPSFCCSGLLPPETPDPNLRINGMSAPLHLPLSGSSYEEQVCELKQLSARAPCGIGTETVINEEIRRCRQVNASEISLSPAWDAAVQQLARRVAAQLGVLDDAVSAHLHKLVLYRPGDMFRAHVDSEKQPRMFATLVLQLPSECSGALLIVKHGGVEKQIDLSSGREFDDDEDPIPFRYAAFFTDCVHEVTALQYGVRVALLYNLVRDKRRSNRLRNSDADTATPKTDLEVVRRLKDCAGQWSDSVRSEPTPLRLMLPLQHRYTPRDISFANLKGADAAMALHVRQSGAFEMRLLLVERNEEKFAKDGVDSESELDEDFDRRMAAMSPAKKRRRLLVANTLGSDLQYEKGITAIKAMGETGKDSINAPWMYALDWKIEALDGDLFSSPELPVDGGYRVTGNEGIRIDLTYQRAVLVLWPKANAPMLSVLREFDRHARELLAQIKSGGASEQGASREHEHDAQWALLRSMSGFYPYLAVESLLTLLDIACRRKETQLVKRLLWQAAGNYRLSDDYESGDYREVYISSCYQLGLTTQEHVGAFMQAIELCGAVEVSKAVIQCVWRSWHSEKKHCIPLSHALLDLQDVASVKLGVEIAKQVVERMRFPTANMLPALVFREECSSLYPTFLKELTGHYFYNSKDLLTFLRVAMKEIEMPNRAKARAFFLQPFFKMCTNVTGDMTESVVASVYKLWTAHANSVNVDDLSKEVRMKKSCIFVHKLLQHADMLAIAKTDTVRRLAQWHARRLLEVQGTRLAGQPDTEIEGHAALSKFLRGDEQKFVSERLKYIDDADHLSKRLSGFSVSTEMTYLDDGVLLTVTRNQSKGWNVALTDADVNKKMKWLQQKYDVSAEKERENGSKSKSDSS